MSQRGYIGAIIGVVTLIIIILTVFAKHKLSGEDPPPAVEEKVVVDPTPSSIPTPDADISFSQAGSADTATVDLTLRVTAPASAIERIADALENRKDGLGSRRSMADIRESADRRAASQFVHSEAEPLALLEEMVRQLGEMSRRLPSPTPTPPPGR